MAIKDKQKKDNPIMEEQKYTMQGLEEYIRQGESGQRERGEAWRVAIGLQQVDGLTPSSYLIDTARQHIDGEISISRAKELIDSYYQSASHRDDIEAQRTEEADKVSARITEILSEKTFTFSPSQLTSIHRRLFEGIYKQAGHFRDYNITKNEWVLNGETIFYADYGTISDTLDYELRTEREFSYANVPVDDAIRHLMRFCANIWQIHAFCEGNTRTTAVFMIKYLRTLGFNVLNDVFAQNSWYFRNALVRANYSNLQKGITETTVFLEHFFRSMLLGEEHSFRNRELHIDWRGAESTISTQDNNIQNQSANSALYNLLKCNYCTLEEIAVLRVIQDNPTITQKEIAAEVGKSERTVKSLTVTLQEKEILKRVGSRRTGKWEIVIVFLLSIFLNIGQVFAQSPNCHIGDVITNPDGSKGVVFWLSPDGSGGWMCALNDVSGTFAWSTQSVAVSDFPALTEPSTYTWGAYATVTADTAGYSHTQKLRAAGNASTYPAAYAVDFANGWYLPAIGQLLKLYAQQATICSVLTANGGTEISRASSYWSSTYASNTDGYYLQYPYPYGYWSKASKSKDYYVRPVRSFSLQNSSTGANTNISYLWSTGDTSANITVSPNETTSYQVITTNESGCSSTSSFTLYVNNADTIFVADNVCQGEPYTGQGFNIPADSTMIPHTIVETRRATSLQTECDSITILTLTVSNFPEVTIQSTADTICSGSSATLSASVPRIVAIGDILCTDNSIVKPSDWPVAGKTPMGIVFYVDSTDKHGWAVALTEFAGASWGSIQYGDDVPDITNYDNARDAMTDKNGLSNTLAIKNMHSSNFYIYEAAYYCYYYDHIIGDHGNTPHGWYLPAAGQLRTLYNASSFISATLTILEAVAQPFSGSEYWSSSECNYYLAWSMRYNGSLNNNSQKYYRNLHVRPIITF